MNSIERLQSLMGLIAEAAIKRAELTKSDDLVDKRELWLLHCSEILEEIFGNDSYRMEFNSRDYTGIIWACDSKETALAFARSQFDRDIEYFQNCRSKLPADST